MTVQLPLPAGWARHRISRPDPRDRLEALRQAELDVKAAIRIQFDALADCFGIQTREIDRAMASIDDTISDLVYEVETELNDKVDRLGECALQPPQRASGRRDARRPGPCLLPCFGGRN